VNNEYQRLKAMDESDERVTALLGAATHELNPIGTREAVERVIAEMAGEGDLAESWGDALRRALEGGR